MSRGRSTGMGVPHDGDVVAVTCWCELAIVWVPIEQVRNLRTECCGHPGCGE